MMSPCAPSPEFFLQISLRADEKLKFGAYVCHNNLCTFLLRRPI